MIDTILQIGLNRQETIKKHKESGKRLCGYVSGLVPEEMIHAAGMVPIMVGPTTHDSKRADALLQTFVCEHVRGCLEAGLAGDWSDLDGMVFTRTCDAVRNLYTIWLNNVGTGFSFYLSTPGNTDADAIDYFARELERLRDFLKEGTGRTVSMDSLLESIAVYNRNRALMRSLVDSGRLSGTQLFHLFNAALIADPLDLYRILDELDPEAVEMPEGSVKLAVTGSHFSDPEIVAVMENLGAQVAVLDLEIGFRRFATDVVENGDPLLALARRYLGSGLDPSKHPARDRFDLLLSQMETANVDGVVVTNQRYCDTYLFEEPLLKEILDEKSIPSLFLKVGERLEHGEQLANRIQAFLETIENR
ncbi:MAG: 2-hydroxyacyl-CoA dehydratase [Proteobacteria bacterium]|nr:2-hydroxyacyl-CoA dehydratase [Pseudomonadota bacterium]